MSRIANVVAIQLATGTIWLVEKKTGAVRPIPRAQYIEAQRSGLLAGFAARLTEAEARETQAEIFLKNSQRN